MNHEELLCRIRNLTPAQLRDVVFWLSGYDPEHTQMAIDYAKWELR